MSPYNGLFLFIENYSLYLSLGIIATSALIMGLFYRSAIRRSVNQHIAQLPYSSQHLNAIINSLNDIIFEFNDDKLCLNAWYNSRTYRVVDPKQLVGKTLEQVLGQERASKYNQALDFVIKKHEQTSLEYLSDHGTGKWFVAKFTPVFDDAGNYAHRITVSVSDISAQRSYSDALEEKERQLLEAQAIAKIGNWLYEGATGETILSANFLNILGTDKVPDGKDKFEYYLSLVHPDDAEACHNFLVTTTFEDTTEHEHRLITAAGDLKFIKITIGDKVFNNDGSLQRIFGIIQDTTDSRLSDKALKKGRSELIEAQTIAKIGNWSWNTVTHNLSCSDEIYHIFEVNSNILKHSNMRRLLLSCVHANDKFILQHLFKSATNIENYTCVFRIVTPGGVIKYLSVIVGKLLKTDTGGVRKIIGTLQDVTERKLVEIDYKRTENKYKLVLETIKLAAVSLDRNGYIIFCNQHLANLLGYTQKEIMGMHWFDNFIPDELKASIREMLANNAVPQQYTNPVVCRNGEQRIVSWQNTISYDENGLLKETTSIGEDITDQQKATRDLIYAKELAEKASKFKSDFLSIMSHEIRTPMNAVIGTTNLLLTENPRPDQLDYLNILKFSGENLLAIINDILDYNKIEAGKLELNEVKFNLHTLMQQIKQTFAARAAEKKLGFELTIDNNIPQLLMGDQNRLSQILNNLISNAIKFTLKGGITIALKNERVNSKEVVIKFTVADTGIGIAADNIDLIFDPFVQETAVNNNNVDGTGLGLAITKRLVNLHKGDISVKSQPGDGTTFTFTIALKLPETITDLPETTADASIVKHEQHLRGMKVLVVDDNKMNLLIASRFLKKWHADVDEALDGQLAVNMVKAKAYDLIIMDLQMPVMDGFEATAIIKTMQPYIPIIALTADAMPETYTKALAAGMSDYLTKPFVPAVFFEKIAKYYVPVGH
jgi:two-component system sensor histidine kinase/response regulator